MQTNGLNQKQIIAVSLISLLLVGSAVGVDMLIKAQPEGRAEETATVSTASSSREAYQYADISSKLTEIVEETPYEPSPSVLNLAYFYPEGADTSDVINSYAGRLYTELTTEEARYLADLYDLSDREPLTMAKELGLPTARVMGKYNPTDPSQDPDNPATWIIKNFKNANVAFYDGDGNRINAYSAVKEIMSMASVYSYFHDMHDAESMKAYAENLWKHSHSYKISMGNVYYCSGCLNKTIQEEAEEAIAQEEQQRLLEESLAKRTAASSGDVTIYMPASTDGPANDMTERAEAEEATLFFDAGSQESSEEDAALGTTEESSSETPAVIMAGNGASAEDRTEGTAEGTTASSTTVAPATVPETAAQETTAPVTAAPATEAPETAPEATLAGFSAARGAEGLRYQGKLILAEGNEATMFGGEAPAETAAATQAPETTAAAAATAPETSTARETTAGPAAELESSSSQSPEEGTLAAVDESSQASRTTTVSGCPGHIDLYITVTIYGIDDINGLMQFDTIGNDPANFNEEWQGWTDEMKEYARQLNAEDWFKRYGLTISAINVTNPLTESEIQDYLNRIPDSVSQQRKDIVSFALHSVGKVPYYWGGKPSAPSYERNGFGTLVAPDTKGRVLRGLDCSGWINWVYWSVLGQRLAGESTGTLIGCGERIARADLQPGDIIVRTGADAHVVMFLEWAGNGNMIVVHETGGVTNNVTVSEMSANWPYYRKLVQ